MMLASVNKHTFPSRSNLSQVLFILYSAHWCNGAVCALLSTNLHPATQHMQAEGDRCWSRGGQRRALGQPFLTVIALSTV